MAVTDALGHVDWTWYQYDSAGDLDSLIVKWDSIPATRGFRFHWDELGRRQQVEYPLGTMAVSYRYDATGLLRRMWVTSAPDPDGPSESLLGVSETVDTVDPSGRVLYRELTCEALLTQTGNPCGELGLQTQWNRYDRLGWLVSQHSNDTDLSDSLRYDASGNMTWRKQGLYQPKTFTMAAGHNRLIKVVQPGSDSLGYTYDDDGNRAQEAKFDNPSGFATRAFFYDGLGRTSGIGNYYFEPGYGAIWVGGPNRCRHDALGRQIKACPEWAPDLSLDGESVIRAADWRIRHGPGLDDPLIALVRDHGTYPRELYYLTNGAGRHYAVAESTGTIHPDVWGEAVSGYIGFRSTGAVTKSHSFGEERLTTATGPGLSFFRNRVYDQETGRWTQEDLIGIAGGINLYQFNGNDPATYDDPYGLCPPLDANDGPHCYTAGITQLTPVQLRAVTDDAARRNQRGALKQIVGAAGDFVRNFLNMREANTIGADKYFHCMANCQAAQRGSAGEATAAAISNLREASDQVRGTPADSSVPDQEANGQGRDGGRANPNVPCANICYTHRPNGLDPEY